MTDYRTCCSSEIGIKDVYLESGLENHKAHEYFKSRGFVKVSEIYKLM